MSESDKTAPLPPLPLLAMLRSRYECRDGGLYVAARYNSAVQIGERAGCIKDNGYRQVRIGGRTHQEHILVWLWHTGEWPVHEIDHINGQRDDNRFENLRSADRTLDRFWAKVKEGSGRRMLGVDRSTSQIRHLPCLWNRARAPLDL